MRVAGLKQQVAVRLSEKNPDGMTPEEGLRAITATVRALQNEHCRCLLEGRHPGPCHP